MDTQIEKPQVQKGCKPNVCQLRVNEVSPGIE